MQMIDFLVSLPLSVLAIVLNVWLMGFSLASLWALRRWVLPRLHLNTNASLFYAAAVMQSVMVLYGLVAALTAVNAWSRHWQATDIVSSESTAIASVWRDLGGYPEQNQGRIPRAGVEWMDRFLAQLLVFEPTSESQKILHATTLNAFNRMHEARRQRLDAVNSRLPGVMWIVLLPGAMGCLLFSLFFPIEEPHFQAVLVAGLAGFVAMVLFMILSLDRPFQGPMAIPSDSYQLVHDQLMKR